VDDKVDRYFLNVASLHLSAKAGARVAKYKRLGNLSYVLGAIDAFRDHQNRNLKVRVTGITSLFHHFWYLRESSEKLLS
jgi:diacylglycerol kinase family enzyme